MTSDRIHRAAAVPLALAALLGLAACGERTDGQTVGQKVDSAIERSSEAARDVSQQAREGAASAGDATRDAVQESRTAVMGAGAETREAVSGAGSKVAAKVDDAQITAGVKSGLAADKDLQALKIDVDTQQGVVTLTGSAPSASAKQRASEIARKVKDVKSVKNQLAVQAG